MFLLNSRLGLFTATTFQWLPFSRSYGGFLPSSLTRVLPFVLQFSCRLPVSVCGTGTSISTLAAFLASVNSSASLLVFAPCHHPALRHAYFTTCLPHDLAPAFHPRSPTILLCPCFELLRWYWNIYQLSIIYAFRPQLRSRLTLGGRTFPRKP